MGKQRAASLLEIKLIFKRCVVIDNNLLTGFVWFTMPKGNGCGVPARLIRSYGKHYAILASDCIATIELGFDRLHITVCPPEESDLPLKTYGPCFYLSYIEKIVNAKTGEQLWPKPAK